MCMRLRVGLFVYFAGVCVSSAFVSINMFMQHVCLLLFSHECESVSMHRVLAIVCACVCVHVHMSCMYAPSVRVQHESSG